VCVCGEREEAAKKILMVLHLPCSTFNYCYYIIIHSLSRSFVSFLPLLAVKYEQHIAVMRSLLNYELSLSGAGKILIFNDPGGIDKAVREKFAKTRPRTCVVVDFQETERIGKCAQVKVHPTTIIIIIIIQHYYQLR
jgi:hypothetical protein